MYSFFIGGGMRACVPGHVCKSGHNFCRGVLSFHHVGSVDQIRVVKLCGRHLYLWIHLSSPYFVFKLLHFVFKTMPHVAILSCVAHNSQARRTLREEVGRLGESEDQEEVCCEILSSRNDRERTPTTPQQCACLSRS